MKILGKRYSNDKLISQLTDFRYSYEESFKSNSPSSLDKFSNNFHSILSNHFDPKLIENKVLDIQIAYEDKPAGKYKIIRITCENALYISFCLIPDHNCGVYRLEKFEYTRFIDREFFTNKPLVQIIKDLNCFLDNFSKVFKVNFICCAEYTEKTERLDIDKLSSTQKKLYEDITLMNTTDRGSKLSILLFIHLFNFIPLGVYHNPNYESGDYEPRRSVLIRYHPELKVKSETE